MSNMILSINWIDGIVLEKYCAQDEGRASFRLNFKTNFRDYASHQDEIEVSLLVNAGSVAKFERIAAAINTIMAEPDAEPAADAEAFIMPARAEAAE